MEFEQQATHMWVKGEWTVNNRRLTREEKVNWIWTADPEITAQQFRQQKSCMAFKRAFCVPSWRFFFMSGVFPVLPGPSQISGASRPPKSLVFRYFWGSKTAKNLRLPVLPGPKSQISVAPGPKILDFWRSRAYLGPKKGTQRSPKLEPSWSQVGVNIDINYAWKLHDFSTSILIGFWSILGSILEACWGPRSLPRASFWLLWEVILGVFCSLLGYFPAIFVSKICQNPNSETCGVY